MPIFLAYFGSVHHEFRLPELVALSDVVNTTISFLGDVDMRVSPFILVELPSEEVAVQIASRSVSLKGFFEIWGQGTNYEEVVETVKNFALLNPEKVQTCAAPDRSFKFVVDAYGKKIPRSVQVEKMDLFRFLNFGGPITMENPTNTFWILEDVGENLPIGQPPHHIYFTREIARGKRDLIDKFNLKKRLYLGTTSMDAELSLFSSNQARIKPGSLIIDPFAGTGSFLVTSAHFGAMTLGGDIDIRILRGKEPGKSVQGNFQQYGLQNSLMDLVRFDHSKNNVLRTTPIFDAVITDPPYGVRAGAKKVGLKKKDLQRINDTDLPTGWNSHITQTVSYSVPEVLTDLLDFAARNLVVGGYLVFWLPTTNEYKHTDLPGHPCLSLVSNSEQPMSMKWRRRLITMKKVIPYHPLLHPKTMIDYNLFYDSKEVPAHANYAMKRLNDVLRHDLRHVGKTHNLDFTTKEIDQKSNFTANGGEGEQEKPKGKKGKKGKQKNYYQDCTTKDMDQNFVIEGGGDGGEKEEPKGKKGKQKTHYQEDCTKEKDLTSVLEGCGDEEEKEPKRKKVKQ